MIQMIWFYCRSSSIPYKCYTPTPNHTKFHHISETISNSIIFKITPKKNKKPLRWSSQSIIAVEHRLSDTLTCLGECELAFSWQIDDELRILWSINTYFIACTRELRQVLFAFAKKAIWHLLWPLFMKPNAAIPLNILMLWISKAKKKETFCYFTPISNEVVSMQKLTNLEIWLGWWGAKITSSAPFLFVAACLLCIPHVHFMLAIEQIHVFGDK